MKTIIIEDNELHRQELAGLLATHCPIVDIVAQATNAMEGAKQIMLLEPELVLLDIELPDRSGFDMLAQLAGHHFNLVFVTGYNQYAIQAIKASALDYLLKPVQPAELMQAIWKCQQQRVTSLQQGQVSNLLQLMNSHQKADHRIALHLQKEIRFELPSNIIRCEANNTYTWFHLVDGKKLLVTMNIGEFQPLLENYGFIKCHQSHLVNRVFVTSLLREDRIYELALRDGSRIPVSRLKKDMVKDILSA